MATLKTGWIKKVIDNVSTKVFAISHVKSIYYNYTEGKLLSEKLDDVDSDISNLSTKLEQVGSGGGGSDDTKAPKENPVFTGAISLGRKASSTSGTNSVAVGYDVTASGSYSHAEGNASEASGESSHAEGEGTVASGSYSHAEGRSSIASESYSHAEGYNSEASGKYSHAEGSQSEASGKYSHSEGLTTTARGDCSHAEGNSSVASGESSHAEGEETVASGYCSHTEGLSTTASDFISHAEGYHTTALRGQHVIGHYNNTTTATEGTQSGTSGGSAFVIGNGTNGSASNGVRVTYEGKAYGLSSYTTSGADFSEFREWLDGNTNNEDRVGYFVTMKGKKIQLANEGDYIRGVTSGNPCIIGNGDECWRGRYILDDFGRFIYEEAEESMTIRNEDGEKCEIPMKVRRMKENSDYDNSKEYIQRSDRPEWSTVGMIGVLPVRDDGTCEIDGFCKVANGGIATKADWSEGTFQNPVYRVVNRINDNIIEIEL